VRRRDFITLVGGAAAGWPLAARAQQPALPVIGYLSGASSETMHDWVAVFKQNLAETGLTEGRDVAIEYRWAEDHNDRLPELVADLVRHDVAVVPTRSKSVSSQASRILAATLLVSRQSTSN
jgi:putative tryptophan/tyrosine transport system substrate-binding protein